MAQGPLLAIDGVSVSPAMLGSCWGNESPGSQVALYVARRLLGQGVPVPWFCWGGTGGWTRSGPRQQKQRCSR